MSRLPRIGVTIGDPAGVGPEIAVRALADERVAAALVPLVVGDAATVEQAIAACELPLRVRAVDDARMPPETGIVDVLQVGPTLAPVRFGEIDATYGAAAASYIERAVALARAGDVDGLVTGPINKEALRASGSPHPGHTEMLAELFDVPIGDVLTMFTVERLRIFFLTRHHSLRAAIDLLEIDLVLDGLRRAQELMLELGFEAPRLAVAALNPHAGEHGLMGVEDDEIVRPAVERARAEGIDARGPVPADAVFWSCRQGNVDAVLALYHDQGHIAAKTVDFFGTVSCTLGLPVIRAAAEHGTAFDIAGRWIADPGGQTASMLAAAELASLGERR